MDSTEPTPAPNPSISPPQVAIVVGWLVTASMVVAVSTRCATKISLKRLLGIDDYLIIAATTIGIGQMVATFIQAHLTSQNSLLEGNDWFKFQKSLFSSQLLFVPAICLAKLSVLYSLHQITPVREHKAPIIAFAGIVGLMMVAFEFSASFQCLGHHWEIFSGQCFRQTPFWQAFGALDIATDTFIVIFPVYIVSTLQMGLKFKCVIAGVFVSRIAAVAASICRIVYLSRSDGNLTHDTFSFWIYIMTTEIEQGLSIITACIPFLKPFFESLETGMLAPSHGLATVVGSAGGSGNRSNKSKISAASYKLRSNPEHSINVSRRISTHSEELGLIKEETTTWVTPMPTNRLSQ